MRKRSGRTDRQLKNGDAEVASAAAVALGHIGGDAAAGALERSLAARPAGRSGRGCRRLHPLRGEDPGGVASGIGGPCH